MMFLGVGKAAVVAFVLIGAFFLSEKQFKLSRVVKLCITTFIYSWLVYLGLMLYDPKLVSAEKISDIWLPIPLPSNYWFVIGYVYMLLLMPFMNLILRRCSQRQLKIILGLLFIFWCVMQFMPNNKLDNANYNFFDTDNYFVFIYLIGGYIRKYNTQGSFMLSILSLIGMLLLTFMVVFIIITFYTNYYDEMWIIMANNNTPVSILIGVPLFLTFKNLHIGHSLIINYISKSMFGVYLIHDNSFMRPFLWQQLVHTAPYAKQAGQYLQYGIITSVVIFCACIVVDVLKRLIIDSVIMKPISQLTKQFVSWTSMGD